METNIPDNEKKPDDVEELLDMGVPEPQNPVVIVRKAKKKRREVVSERNTKYRSFLRQKA